METTSYYLIGDIFGIILEQDRFVGKADTV
jgi:hypothetical protein